MSQSDPALLTVAAERPQASIPLRDSPPKLSAYCAEVACRVLAGELRLPSAPDILEVIWAAINQMGGSAPPPRPSELIDAKPSDLFLICVSNERESEKQKLMERFLAALNEARAWCDQWIRLSTGDMASYLNVSEKTIYNMLQDARLPHLRVKDGDYYFVSESTLRMLKAVYTQKAFRREKRKAPSE